MSVSGFSVPFLHLPRKRASCALARMCSVPVQRRPLASCRKAIVCLEVRAVTHCWGVPTRRTRRQERGPRSCREPPQRNGRAGLRAPEAPRASQERGRAGTERRSGLQGLTLKRRPKPGTERAPGPAPTEPNLLALEKTRARLRHTGQEEASGAVLRARAPSRKGAQSGPGPGRASRRTRTSRSLWPTGKPRPRHSSRNEGMGLCRECGEGSPVLAYFPQSWWATQNFPRPGGTHLP